MRWLARYWPYGPLLAATAMTVWQTTGPWVAAMGVCWVVTLAWEGRCRRRDPLPRHTPGFAREAAVREVAGMAPGHPERLTGRLPGGQERSWEAIVDGWAAEAPERDRGER